MPRLSDPDQIFFPVEERDVYVGIGTGGNEMLHRISDKKAIVNVDNQKVFAIVAENYQLLTNVDAMEAAFECCSLVFPETHSSEWTISAVDAPSTGSYCHIDLVHQTATLEFDYVMTGRREEVPDVFGPFIRVTNSYNGSHALAFSIGFYRKVCGNGMVSPEDLVRFRFKHTRQNLRDSIVFDVDTGRLDQAKRSFIESFRALHDCPVKLDQFARLIRMVLRIRDPRKSSIRGHGAWIKGEDKAWTNLENHINCLSEKYVEQLGENAYAALNAMTELASRPPPSKYLRKDKHRMQKLAGEWVIAFNSCYEKPSFNFSSYLEELEGSAEVTV